MADSPKKHARGRGLLVGRGGKFLAPTAMIAVLCTMAYMLLWDSSITQQAAALTYWQPPDSRDCIHNATSHSAGLCELEYTVFNWEGKKVKVCDPAICTGHRSMRALPTPKRKQRRWTAAAEADYLASFRNNSISGWLQPGHIQFVKVLTAMQHTSQVFGAVGEIGVHHGKFFMVLAGNALQEEPAVAMDLFADQRSNIDRSGNGNLHSFLFNAGRMGLSRSSLDVWQGNSMELTAGNFSDRGLPAFRMLSVDGGHSLEITLHDIMLASCVLRPGGIVVLDDVQNSAWIGVGEAMTHWVHAQSRLVPFLVGFNKMYFTTSSHVKQYYQYVSSQPQFKCVQDLHDSRRTLGGYSLCFTQ